MLQLVNDTPFQSGLAVFPDRHAIDTLYITVKATFTIGSRQCIGPEQVPVVAADTFWGEPGASSLKYASETHLGKPATDLILMGHAQAPGRRQVSRIDVMVAAGGRKKTIRVFGDRFWTGGLIPPLHSAPLPFTAMPLVYERSFGGVREDPGQQPRILFEARNPVGCGLVGTRRRKELKGLPLPNLEDPACLISEPGDRPVPVCFGFVAPAWEPRRSLAGTYDQAWTRQRAPYLPLDFDSRFFNAAHPDLICQGHLEGGETVEVVNASAEGPLRFRLPRCDLSAAVRVATRIEHPPFHLETVLIEPDDSRVCLLWRAELGCDKQSLKIETVRLDLHRIDPGGRVS